MKCRQCTFSSATISFGWLIFLFQPHPALLKWHPLITLGSLGELSAERQVLADPNIWRVKIKTLHWQLWNSPFFLGSAFSGIWILLYIKRAEKQLSLYFRGADWHWEFSVFFLLWIDCMGRFQINGLLAKSFTWWLHVEMYWMNKMLRYLSLSGKKASPDIRSNKILGVYDFADQWWLGLILDSFISGSIEYYGALCESTFQSKCLPE